MSDRRINHEEARESIGAFAVIKNMLLQAGEVVLIPGLAAAIARLDADASALSAYITQQESQEPDGFVVEFRTIDGELSHRLLANTRRAAEYGVKKEQYSTAHTRIRPFRYLDGGDDE